GRFQGGTGTAGQSTTRAPPTTDRPSTSPPRRLPPLLPEPRPGGTPPRPAQVQTLHFSSVAIGITFHAGTHEEVPSGKDRRCTPRAAGGGLLRRADPAAG